MYSITLYWQPHQQSKDYEILCIIHGLNKTCKHNTIHKADIIDTCCCTFFMLTFPSIFLAECTISFIRLWEQGLTFIIPLVIPIPTLFTYIYYIFYHCYWMIYIYNCPCNIRHNSKVKLHGRNHGNKVKLCPQFCKWRSWERKRKVKENGHVSSIFRVRRW